MGFVYGHALEGFSAVILDGRLGAVKKSPSSGIFYSIAAGNDGANVCNYSPARAGAGTNNGIVTTAATDKYDREYSSNYGSCVDVWASGVDILSSQKEGGTAKMTGTSQAAAHVGGGGALYLASRVSSNRPPRKPRTRARAETRSCASTSVGSETRKAERAECVEGLSS